MRSRAVVAIAFLALPCGMSAQVLRIPRRGGIPAPAPLPPTAGPVARALSLQRARWSAEQYALFSAVQLPDGAGGVSRYTAFGTGTHADYRYADHFTATIDLTASFLGGLSETAETGTRYSPLNLDHSVRPFFDVRAAYMNLRDSYTALGLGAGQASSEGSRYSRGFGAIGGAGIEYTVSSSFALTSELLAMRHRMTTYRLTTTANLPTGATLPVTSYRLTLGIKFNPARRSNLSQNPRS
jgi:hypothetical protein